MAQPDRNDPKTLADTDSIQINVHGVDQTKTQAFRNLVADKYPDWILTPLNSTDYKMNLKPSALIDLKRNTVTQERDTIQRRVYGLGLTEPTVQDYGAEDKQSAILVELPGIDDPAHAKEFIGSAAQLKIVEVKDRNSWKSREEALAAKGGILPLGTELVELARGRGQRLGRVVSSEPQPGHHRARHAQCARGHRSGFARTMGVQLYALAGWRPQVREFYRREYRKSTGGGAR